MDRIPLTLRDVEIIISKTEAAVEAKYNTIMELLENDMRTTMNLIEAERLSLGALITEQQVDKEAYSYAISSIMQRVDEMNENSEYESIQTLQEFMSWRTRFKEYHL